MNNSCPAGYIMSPNGVCEEMINYNTGGSVRKTPMRSRRMNELNSIPPEPIKPKVVGTRDWSQYGGYTPPLYPWEIDPDYFSNNDSRLPCVTQCQQYFSGYCESGFFNGPYCDCSCCHISMHPGLINQGVPPFYCDCGNCSWQYWLCVSLCVLAILGASMGGPSGRAGQHGQPRAGDATRRQRQGGKIRRRR